MGTEAFYKYKTSKMKRKKSIKSLMRQSKVILINNYRHYVNFSFCLIIMWCNNKICHEICQIHSAVNLFDQNFQLGS